MNGTIRAGMSIGELLRATLRVWSSRAGMFCLLMGIPIAALAILSVIVVYVIVPHPQDMPLREVFQKMSFLEKLSVFAVFLGSFAMQYRALAASCFATQEIWSGRDVGVFQAIRSVRRKQLRLFWIVMLVSVFTGPLGLVAFPFFSFYAAPGFPVAILENTPAFAAIKRGDALGKGGKGALALLVVLWLVLGIAAAIGLVSFLTILEEHFGRPWFLRPVPALGFWVIMLIPQLYIIALTLNFLEQRRHESDMNLVNPRLVKG